MILNFDPQSIQASNDLDQVIFFRTKEEVLAQPRIHDQVTGILVRLGITLDREFLSNFKQLKFVATVTTGEDHIDQTYCKEKDIYLISLKGHVEFLQGIYATPEHTWGLLLALVRRTPWAYQSVCEGRWVRSDFFGTELKDKILGIIGYGRVGKIIACYAHAFGMNILAFDREPVTANSALNLKPATLEEVLSRADVVSLHLPFNEQTNNFFRKEHFCQMKPTAFFINTARSGLVNEQDLLWTLQNKRISGAALDVISDETKESINSHHPLIQYANQYQNLLITPHISGSTHESMNKTSIYIIDQVKKFLKSL